jgi:hypothetical protein
MLISSRSRMNLLVARFAREQCGNYTILAAVVLPVLVGVGGLGTEAGLWLYRQQTAQGAADLGAISAATAGGGSSRLVLEAQAIAASYGLINGLNGVSVTVNQPPQSGTHIGTAGAVEVIVKQPQARLFSALFGSQAISVSARAVAVGGSPGCLLALDASAAGAISVQGSSQVNLKNCNLYDNSSSSTALSVGGSGTLSAGAIDVVGSVSGTSSITAANGIATGAPAMADPYANAPFGSYSSLPCLSAAGLSTLSPGRYCSGITLTAGANVTLNPGIYYLDQGSLSIAGNATLTGTGVTLVFTSSTGTNWANAKISSNATINLTAPTSGATAGIVMFGDRGMPAGTSFKLEGGGVQNFGGAVYLPKAALTFTGGSSTGTVCTQIIADTVTFTGNSNLAASCSGYGVNSFGGATAALVE